MAYFYILELHNRRYNIVRLYFKPKPQRTELVTRNYNIVRLYGELFAINFSTRSTRSKNIVIGTSEKHSFCHSLTEINSA